MHLYSYQGNYPTTIPFRIVLSNGITRTDPSTFTEEEILDAGYAKVLEKPSVLDGQVAEWLPENLEWIVRDKTEQELFYEKEAQWESVRNIRDALLEDTDYVVLVSYEQGIPVPEEYVVYRKELRDIPQTQEDPFNIIWPTLYPEES